MSGIVYVISDDTGLNKIGFCASIRTRFKGVQADRGRPCRIEYLTDVMDKAHHVERLAHDLVTGDRIYGLEWFACSTDEAISAVEQAIVLANETRRDFYKVREWRKLIGISVDDAAQLLNRSAGMLRMWEQGRRVPSQSTRILMTAIASGFKGAPYA